MLRLGCRVSDGAVQLPVGLAQHMIKHHLVSLRKFISVGCKLPDDVNEQYGFHNIPLDVISYELLLLEREGQRRSPLAERYLQLLEKELKTV